MRDIVLANPMQYMSVHYVRTHNIGRDALYTFIMYGNLDVVKLFTQRTYHVHQDHNRPLRIACSYGHLDIVKYLISRGADVNDSDYSDTNVFTALRGAIGNNHLDVVKYLVSCGADINDGPKNYDPVQCASYNGCLEVLTYLVSIGANVNPKTLKYAIKSGHIEVVKYLVSIGLDIDPSYVNSAIKSGSVTDVDDNQILEVINYIISLGKFIDYNSWLITAVDYDYIDFVKYFLSIGANDIEHALSITTNPEIIAHLKHYQ